MGGLYTRFSDLAAVSYRDLFLGPKARIFSVAPFHVLFLYSIKQCHYMPRNQPIILIKRKLSKAVKLWQSQWSLFAAVQMLCYIKELSP